MGHPGHQMSRIAKQTTKRRPFCLAGGQSVEVAQIWRENFVADVSRQLGALLGVASVELLIANQTTSSTRHQKRQKRTLHVQLTYVLSPSDTGEAVTVA